MATVWKRYVEGVGKVGDVVSKFRLARLLAAPILLATSALYATIDSVANISYSRQTNSFDVTAAELSDAMVGKLTGYLQMTPVMVSLGALLWCSAFASDFYVLQSLLGGYTLVVMWVSMASKTTINGEEVDTDV